MQTYHNDGQRSVTPRTVERPVTVSREDRQLADVYRLTEEPPRLVPLPLRPVVPAGHKLGLLRLMRTFAGGGASVSGSEPAPDRRVLLGLYRPLGARSTVLRKGRAQPSVGRVRT